MKGQEPGLDNILRRPSLPPQAVLSLGTNESKVTHPLDNVRVMTRIPSRQFSSLKVIFKVNIA